MVRFFRNVLVVELAIPPCCHEITFVPGQLLQIVLRAAGPGNFYGVQVSHIGAFFQQNFSPAQLLNGIHLAYPMGIGGYAGNKSLRMNDYIQHDLFKLRLNLMKLVLT